MANDYKTNDLKLIWKAKIQHKCMIALLMYYTVCVWESLDPPHGFLANV